MNNAGHLLPEDRPEFERILQEALQRSYGQPEQLPGHQRLNAEQLRTMALASIVSISAHADVEYERYVHAREAVRRPVPAEDGGSADGQADDGAVLPPEATGAGLLAIIAVLAPVLAAAAAVIFLVFGYALRTVRPDEPFADSMIGAGWVFVVLTAAGIVVATAGLLATALRDGAGSLRAAHRKEPAAVALARDAWQRALLERGILPFLRDAEPAGAPSEATAGGGRAGEPKPTSRMPPLGYTKPDFSSPGTAPAAGGGDPGPAARPTYQSPGYSSPDYGGPEHEPT